MYFKNFIPQTLKIVKTLWHEQRELASSRPLLNKFSLYFMNN